MKVSTPFTETFSGGHSCGSLVAAAGGRPARPRAKQHVSRGLCGLRGLRDERKETACIARREPAQVAKIRNFPAAARVKEPECLA